MTRLTDEEIQFYIDNPWSKVDLGPIATELKQARTEIATLQDQLRTLRENRFHASGLLDCKAKCEKYEEALKLLADRMPGCPCMDSPNIAREALK